MNRIIEWFARNGVAANVLMFIIVAGGLITLPSLKQEVFPEFSSGIVTVTVDYLGATPEEVEEGVCVRIEEAIYGLAGIKTIKSTASEGRALVTVELLPGADTRRLVEEIKGRVDAIDTFPEETEKPIVEELVQRRQVIEVAVSGDTDEHSLRRVADRVRNEIAALDGISLVELAGARPYEVSIEVSEDDLRRFGLTFDEVARAIRGASLDLPAGSVKTEGGEVLVRTKGQAYTRRDYERLTLISRIDGTRVALGEVADVIDGFADTDQSSSFDGEPAILVQVFRVGDQSALQIAATVHDYVEKARLRVPAGISLTTWQDDSAVLRSRIGLLVNNGLMGLALVCLSLALFLRLGLALWVAWGIPLSFLGAIWLLPLADISVNLISLFAFIVVLGIVVDDAIVVAENIFTELQQGRRGIEAAVRGAQRVAMPVTFAVLTSIAAFGPLMGVPGNMGKILALIPAIVIATLFFSLVESLLVLPAHLAHLRPDGVRSRSRSVFTLPARGWRWLQTAIAGGLFFFTRRVYSPALELALHWRYTTAGVGIATLVVTAALVLSGKIQYILMPKVDADNVVAYVTMPLGTPVARTSEGIARIREAAERLRRELERDGKPVYRHVLASVGSQPYREAQNLRRGKTVSFSGGHLGEVNIELVSAEERAITSTEIARRWRALVGSIPDALELSYTSSLFSAGEPINVELRATDVEILRGAAGDLKDALASFAGVTDIADSFRPGKQEIKLAINPAAESLGLSLSDLARQARQGFYGEEVQRIQRGRDDVRVMLRYPAEERRSLGHVESMRIRTPAGDEVPFTDVAAPRLGRGFADIQRADRQRIVNVTADIEEDKTNATQVVESLRASVIPDLVARYPGLSYSLEGEQREQRETFGGIARGFVLALVMIYALLAIPFRSYFQPIIVMSAIPFGIVGVIWGHVLIGLDLTILSLFGLVALTGVVVNDSLIMVDFINRARREHETLGRAVRHAGVVRFRPILLTSLTTFLGLTPLLLERSMQAQFLKPMAASLGFGVLFATFVTLILVPVGYLILEDLLGFFRFAGPDEAEDGKRRADAMAGAGAGISTQS